MSSLLISFGSTVGSAVVGYCATRLGAAIPGVITNYNKPKDTPADQRVVPSPSARASGSTLAGAGVSYLSGLVFSGLSGAVSKTIIVAATVWTVAVEGEHAQSVKGQASLSISHRNATLKGCAAAGASAVISCLLPWPPAIAIGAAVAYWDASRVQ